MSILEKPARDLTAEEYSSIRKPLGRRVPYPMMGMGYVTDGKGKKKLTRYLGVLAQDLMITSELSLDEIEGRLLREMSTPEMLPLFHEVMSAIDPRNERRAMLLIGAPGSGKTFLGEQAGDIGHKKGAITIDCTGMNLSELFFETVLDFNGNQRFYDALDAKLDQYNVARGNKKLQDSILNPLSVDILREHLGTAFSEENGKICIDWGHVKYAHGDGTDGSPVDTRRSIEIAIDGLRKISAKEGMDNLGGNALGMATQEGPAWRAYKEGRVLVLDELNRAKRGTFGIVHRWMQFIIGEKKDCFIRNPLKEKGDQTKAELYFHRNEMGAGHFVFGTSNEQEDSDEVFELPEALSSRIVPQHIPKATLRGWQHRLCQIWSGMPISTLYNAQRDVWDTNPDAFGRKLLEWRFLCETREVPDFQVRLLQRWKDTMQAAENLAVFLDSAAKTIDPGSEWHKSGTLQQLLDNISESFKKEVSVDFRKISYFLNKAFQPKPVVRPPSGANDVEITPLIGDTDIPETPEDIRRKIGTHMTYVIMDWIISISYERGKDDLGNQLMRLAADCALIDPQLIEGLPSSRRTFAELLDENVFENNHPDARATLVRDLLCDYLRKKLPGLSDDNDDIMPTSAVHRAIEEINKKNPRLAVFNDDLDSLDASPLQEADGIDLTPINGQKSPALPAAERLVSRYALLASLAAPDLRERNLAALWNDALSASGAVSRGIGEMTDNSLGMAENRAANGVAVTTVIVRDSDDKGAAKSAPLHILWNKNFDRILVVGEGDISSGLKRAFNDARVFYVDSKTADAEKCLQNGIGYIFGKEDKSLRKAVSNAFLMRNRLPTNDDGKETEGNLEDILLQKNLDCFLPHYLVMKPQERKIA